MNRLTSAVTGPTTETWSYDKNGNRTIDTKTGTATVYSAFNAADELCWTGPATGSCPAPPTGAAIYAYDANGNTTTAGTATSTYNVFDQFTSNTNTGTTTNFTYAGPRNDERTTAGATSFLNGTLGITQQTTAGATTSFIRDPSGTLISMRDSTGASFYYTTDALGSVLLLTDSSQAAAATYSYDSWGNTTSSGAQAATNPWTYAGGYNDTTNNRIKFGARYYNPFRGRFTQTDPSGQESNRYLYAGANPINASDPSGLSFGGDLFGGIVGGAVALGFGIIVTVAAGPFLTPLGSALLGASIGACVGGAIAVGAANAYDGGTSSGAQVGYGCAGGVITAIAGVLGRQP
ncbi:hypothetical protein OIT41_20675 (plasmid) [Arthrobacter sp. YA7-1]|uniref:RHS repeat-associated core domain-containing protein n=1 Tax=Arthrobacter sp. YA7-1 TaxID=2987701 RepID=UPI002226F079|nr:RHS repeat-associated core domain-containing protein [Arthrobacter sp. YA7-1]UYY83682.1 hypothetical protein OIT41_20675 [Arthrobacter sp. YA7-1]